MKIAILAGGPSKEVGAITSSVRSRSLLLFPHKTLLEKHLDEALKYYDGAYVVSDDQEVGSICEKYEGCIFVRQKTPGIEGAICDFISFASPSDEIVTIDYGDIYFSKGYIESHVSILIRTYEPLVTVTRPFTQRTQYLNVQVDYVSQQVTGVGVGDYVFAGLISLPSRILRRFLCTEGRNIHYVMESLAKGGSLRANIWLGEWVDIDTPWDYLLAIRFELSKLKGLVISENAKVRETATLEPPVFVESGSLIDHNAVIRGPAYIGRNTLVGAHSFIRNSVALFDNAIVGAYSEVKRSIVYKSAKIASHSYIADSIIGEAANIAPYTVTLNVPYAQVSDEIKLTASQLLEKLKIGAVVAAGYKTKPHDVLTPATLYKV